MRYLIILEAKPTNTPPPPSLLPKIFELGDEATKAGAMLDTAGLAPSSAGALIEIAGGKLTVTDGPFAESKELISYAIYDVRTKEEAVEWTRRFMKLHQDLWKGWEGTAKILKIQ